jgi:hypothetical protein
LRLIFPYSNTSIAVGLFGTIEVLYLCPETKRCFEGWHSNIITGFLASNRETVLEGISTTTMSVNNGNRVLVISLEAILLKKRNGRV